MNADAGRHQERRRAAAEDDALRRRRLLIWLAGVAIAWAVAGAITVWDAAAGTGTPAEEVVDPRGPVAFLLMMSTVVASLTRWILGGGGRHDARRRRGAWLVASGTAFAYASLVGTIPALDGEHAVGEIVGYVGVAAGLLVTGVAALWWNSPRSLMAVLAGAYVVATVALVGDIGWQLSGPEVPPFEPCVGGMDCIGVDPEPPLASGWLVFGAFWGSLWVGGALLALLAIRGLAQTAWSSLRPPVRS